MVGVKPQDVEDMQRDAGDIGQAAENLFRKKKQATLFTDHELLKVHSNPIKIATISGSKAQSKKLEILRELYLPLHLLRQNILPVR